MIVQDHISTLVSKLSQCGQKWPEERAGESPSSTPHNLTLPTQLPKEEKIVEGDCFDRLKMKSYVSFVREHEELVRPLETLLRTITFLLPSRFHEHGAGEVTTEAALAASSVLTLFHDLILERPPSSGTSGNGINTERERREGGTGRLSAIPSSSADRTLGHERLLCSNQEKIGLTLTIMSLTEVLLEKLALRLGGEAGAEGLIISLETFKAILKLALLASSSSERGMMLIDGGCTIPSRRTSQELSYSWGGDDHANIDVVSRNDEYRGGRLGNSTRTGRRTGRRFLYELDQAAVSSSSSSSTAMEGMERKRGIAGGSMTAEMARSRLLLMGEILHILRPVVYAYTRWLVSRHRPFKKGVARRGGELGKYAKVSSVLVSGLLDLASYHCTRRALESELRTPLRVPPAWQREMQRRRSLYFLYLLRTPLFELLTLPTAKRIEKLFGGLPLIGRLVSYAVTTLGYIQSHHFYYSGS